MQKLNNMENMSDMNRNDFRVKRIDDITTSIYTPCFFLLAVSVNLIHPEIFRWHTKRLCCPFLCSFQGGLRAFAEKNATKNNAHHGILFFT